MSRAGRNVDLLTEIEQGAHDPKSDLATLLRKCITLGGLTGSESLRRWATLELKGYDDDEKLPAYREAVAPLLLDGTTFTHHVKGQMVDMMMIPDFAREYVNEDIPFRQPIGEIADLLAKARADDDGIARLVPPGMSSLIPFINSINTVQSARVERIYWGVSSTVLVRILDVVRTNLVELVAEMRAGMPLGNAVPTREVAEQAMGVVVGGKRNRVVVNQIQQANDVVTTTGGAGAAGGTQPESSSRRLMWWLVGISTIVAAAAAVFALL